MNQYAIFSVALFLVACNDHVFNIVEPRCHAEERESAGVEAGAPVDILLVVDNSGSMCEEQAALVENFLDPECQSAIDENFNGVAPVNPSADEIDALQDRCGFIQILSFFDATDFRLGVITTDISDCDDAFGFGVNPDLAPNICGGNLAPVGRARRPQRGCLQGFGGERKFLQQGDDDLETKFATILSNVSTVGSSLERGLDATTHFLDGNFVEGQGCDNDVSSFLRPEARLALIYLTDEDDCSHQPNLRDGLEPPEGGDDFLTCSPIGFTPNEMPQDACQSADQCPGGFECLGFCLQNCSADDDCPTGVRCVTRFSGFVDGQIEREGPGFCATSDAWMPEVPTTSAASCYDSDFPLAPVTDYVSRINTIKRRDDTKVAVIGGFDQAGAPASCSRDGDDVSTACVSSHGASNVAEICSLSPPGKLVEGGVACCEADAGSRYAQFATAFGENGQVASICQDFRATLRAVAEFIGRVEGVSLDRAPPNDREIIVQVRDTRTGEVRQMPRIPDDQSPDGFVGDTCAGDAVCDQSAGQRCVNARCTFDGFHYDGATQLDFYGPSAPQPGEIVEVRYASFAPDEGCGTQ